LRSRCDSFSVPVAVAGTVAVTVAVTVAETEAGTVTGTEAVAVAVTVAGDRIGGSDHPLVGPAPPYGSIAPGAPRFPRPRISRHRRTCRARSCA
jgi:hypothetical protein